MTWMRLLAAGLGALVTMSAALTVRASDMKNEIDCAADGKLLGSLFKSYGFSTARTIFLEKQSVRIRLPAGYKGVGQTGLYSFFAMSGDFEVSATYEMISIPQPQEGYGASFGIAVDCLSTGTKVALARGMLPKKGLGYFIVSRGEKPYAPEDWKTTDYVSKSPKGKLTIRREKTDLILLVADGPKESLQELVRFEKFSDATIRPVRVFADTGGSPTGVDARIGELKIRAEELTGAVPKKDLPGSFGGWLTLGGICVLAILAYVLYRRKRTAADEESPAPAKKKTPAPRAVRPK